MRITQKNIRTLKKGDKFWKSNATFTHTHTHFGGEKKLISIKGSCNRKPFIVDNIYKDNELGGIWVIATSPKRELGTNKYTFDEESNGNGLFTTLKEAIALSEKNLGYLG